MGNERLKKFEAKIGDLKRELNIETDHLEAKKEHLLNIDRSLSKVQSEDERSRLIKEKQIIESEIQSFRKTLAEKSIAIDDERTKNLAIIDYKETISSLSDDYPFLLFPVRTEIRFVTIKTVRRKKYISELQADIKIGSVAGTQIFTESGSSSGLKRPVENQSEFGKRKIIGDIQDDIKKGHTHENAIGQKQILKEIYPDSVEDEEQLWVRIFPDNIAITTHEPKLTNEEYLSGISFWKKIWYMGNNEASQLIEWKIICNKYGLNRSMWIVKQTKPANYNKKPVIEINIENTSIEKPLFNRLDLIASKNNMPKSGIMPDRFTAILIKGDTRKEFEGKIIPDPLIVGVNPNNPEVSQADSNEPDDEIPKEIKWLTDFDEAEKIGMGIKIPLDSEFKDKFDKLLILGTKNSQDVNNTQRLIDRLFEAHVYGNRDFSLLPIGFPTNASNTNPEPDDTDIMKHLRFVINEENFQNIITNNKTDGQVLADFLGIDYNIINKIGHYGKYDLKEALAMNEALYPATLGYYLTEFISPIISDDTIASIKKFFLKHVTGRGHISSIRLGSQPYGILPTSAFSKWTYKNNLDSKSFLKSLFENFLNITLKNLLNKPNVFKSLGNTQQGADYEELFLKIIGLNASSVDYAFRLAFGPETVNAGSWTPVDTNQILNKYKTQLGYEFHLASLIFSLAYNKLGDISITPDIALKIDVIDSNPFSEVRKLENIYKTGNEYSNYIEWLRNQSFNNIESEAFLSDEHNIPNSLLYILLRHSMLLAYYDTSLEILHDKQVISTRYNREKEFMNVFKDFSVNTQTKNEIISKMNISVPRRILDKDQLDKFKTKWGEQLQDMTTADTEKFIAELSDTDNRIDMMKRTYGPVSQNMSIANYIDTNIKNQFSSQYSLSGVAKAMEFLKDLPTGRLERLFSEHLDLCSYRLDSWLTGLVNERIASKRFIGNNRKTGSFLGAFGYLENLKPSANRAVIFREVLPINPLLSKMNENDKSYSFIYDPKFNSDETFIYLGKDTKTRIFIDLKTGLLQQEESVNENKGFIHAPSISHAIAAAILRCGYLSSIHKRNKNEMAVNISSERSRIAMFYIDGINSGQHLAALLGYRFERLMHDENLDEYIYDFRLAFPFTINKVTDNTQTIEMDYSRSVVNGLTLTEKETIEDVISIKPDHKFKITSILNKLKSHLDAVADLIMSESIFQLAQGNFVKSGSALSMATKGEGLREPEILRTPSTGTTVTHRLVLAIDASDNNIIKWGTSDSSLSLINPYLNSWLTGLLGNPGKIAVSYNYKENTQSGEVKHSKIMMNELDLQPIDLLYLFQHDSDGNKFDKIYKYIQRFLVFNKNILEPVVEKRTELAEVNEIKIEDLSCLLTPIKEVLLNSQSLKNQDFELPSVSSNEIQYDVFELFSRVKNLVTNTRQSVSEFSDSLKSDNETRINDFLIKNYLLDIPDEAFGLNQNSRVTHLYVEKILNEKLIKIDAILRAFNVKHSSDEETYDLSNLNPANTNKFAECLLEIIKLLTNNQFPVLTSFLLKDYEGIDLAINHSKDEVNGLLSYVGKQSIVPWIQGISKVRQKVNSYNLLKISSELLNNSTSVYQAPLPIQFPIHRQINIESSESLEKIIDKWIGHQYPHEYKPQGNLLSIITNLPLNFNSNNKQAGLLIDEWTEVIPNSEEVTGIAFNYNQPDSEPPQTILMAVAPQDNGFWSWEDLVDSVLETFDLVKIRTLTPDDIWGNQGDYNQVLPALFSATSFNPKESNTVALNTNLLSK